MSVFTLSVIYDDSLMKEKFILDGKLAVREKAIKISMNGNIFFEIIYTVFKI